MKYAIITYFSQILFFISKTLDEFYLESLLYATSYYMHNKSLPY